MIMMVQSCTTSGDVACFRAVISCYFTRISKRLLYPFSVWFGPTNNRLLILLVSTYIPHIRYIDHIIHKRHKHTCVSIYLYILIICICIYIYMNQAHVYIQHRLYMQKQQIESNKHLANSGLISPNRLQKVVEDDTKQHKILETTNE